MISMISNFHNRSSQAPTRRGSVLGIDIGNSAIKMARMESSQGRWTVTNRLAIPSEDSEGSFEESLNNGAFTRQLAILKNRPLATAQKCVCVLPRSVCDFRSFDVPSEADTEVQQMVSDSLRDHFADEFENRTYQMWKHCPSVSGLTSVSCASVDNAVSERIVEELGSVGVKCVGIESQPLAVAQACQLSRIGQSDMPIAVLDWGHSTTSLVIILKGQPQFARTLPNCSGIRAVRIVSEGISLPIEDARQVLAGCGLPSESADGPANALGETLAQLLTPEIHRVSSEVQKTLLYLRNHIPALMPGRMLLMGGMGSVANIAPLIANQSGIETAPWALDSEYAHHSDAVYATAFAVSVGIKA